MTDSNSKTHTTTTFRLPTEILLRLDAYTKDMSQQVPGVRFSRTAAIRALLTKGLDEWSKRK